MVENKVLSNHSDKTAANSFFVRLTEQSGETRRHQLFVIVLVHYKTDGCIVAALTFMFLFHTVVLHVQRQKALVAF